MHKRNRASVALTGLVLAAACVMLPEGQEAEPPPNPTDPITRAEIDRRQWTDTYDLVRTLRPTWVRTRGTDSFENPGRVQVYVDGTRLGDVRLLRTVPTHAIERLEWIDPVTAAGRWGLDHGHGVIFITYGRDGDSGSGTGHRGPR